MARNKRRKNCDDFVTGKIAEDNWHNGKRHRNGGHHNNMQLPITLICQGVLPTVAGHVCRASASDQADCCWVAVATTDCTFTGEKKNHCDCRRCRSNDDHTGDHTGHDDNGKRNGKRNGRRRGDHRHDDHSDSDSDSDCRNGGCCWQVFATTGCSEVPRNPEECCWIILATTACST